MTANTNSPNQPEPPVPEAELKARAYRTVHDALKLIAVGFGERRAELLQRLDAIISEVYHAQK